MSARRDAGEHDGRRAAARRLVETRWGLLALDRDWSPPVFHAFGMQGRSGVRGGKG